jgi:hypothetical protein
LIGPPGFNLISMMNPIKAVAATAGFPFRTAHVEVSAVWPHCSRAKESNRHTGQHRKISARSGRPSNFVALKEVADSSCRDLPSSRIRYQNMILFDQKMVIGRRDVDSTLLKSFFVCRQRAMKSPMFSETGQQRNTRVLGSHMMNDEYGGSKIGWQVR